MTIQVRQPLKKRSLTGLAMAMAWLGLAAAPAGASEWAASTGSFDAEKSIRVPAGFSATVFADLPGSARHIAVAEDGRVFVIQSGRRGSARGVIGLQDVDGDGVSDRQETVSDLSGSGLALRTLGDEVWLYIGTDTQIYRAQLGDGLALKGAPEPIASFPPQSQHATKPMVFDGAGNMYVGIGAPSNACQEQMRSPGSPGLQPCPQLDLTGGIWQFDADTPGQTHGQDGVRFASGIRNPFALDWHGQSGRVLFAQHGRDDLYRLFPDYYTVEDNRDLPAEILAFASAGDDFGWPYTYWDGIESVRRLAPEYGGDGVKQPEVTYPDPLVAFPAHWGPNDLVVYDATSFPEAFHGGAFVAFHGSWNRAPFEQEGYNVAFVPLTEAGEVAGDWAPFADGFVGTAGISTDGRADHRPTGLAVGPDGALYISDSRQGWIWRIVHNE